MHRAHVYLLDPNGLHGALSTIASQETGVSIMNAGESLVEDLFENYFRQFKQTGINLTFIRRRIWNADRVDINCCIQDSCLKDGCCVPTTFMVAHYLAISPVEPIIAYHCMNALGSDYEMFIIGYTAFIISLCD